VKLSGAWKEILLTKSITLINSLLLQTIVITCDNLLYIPKFVWFNFKKKFFLKLWTDDKTSLALIESDIVLLQAFLSTLILTWSIIDSDTTNASWIGLIEQLNLRNGCELYTPGNPRDRIQENSRSYRSLSSLGVSLMTKGGMYQCTNKLCKAVAIHTDR